MLAAQRRAGGAGARAALLRPPSEPDRASSAVGEIPIVTEPRAAMTAPPTATAATERPMTAGEAALSPEVGPPDRDTIFRLREAKKRAARR
jgi:hypothetical protein